MVLWLSRRGIHSHPTYAMSMLTIDGSPRMCARPRFLDRPAPFHSIFKCRLDVLVRMPGQSVSPFATGTTLWYRLILSTSKLLLRADSKITSAFWRAAATAAGVRLHRRISNMPASPSYAALSSPRQNTQFIFEPTLRLEFLGLKSCRLYVSFGQFGTVFAQ